MYIRIRAILTIVLTTLVIISFSILSGIILVQSNIENSQEADLMIISDIADHFISSEIELLKLKTADAAYVLSKSEETELRETMAALETANPELIGVAILDREQGIISSTGIAPVFPEIMYERTIQQAFEGSVTISSTVPSSNGVVFYLAAPLKDTNDRIVTLTLSGDYFSDLVGAFSIWETGHIFVDDADGILISNIRPAWVQSKVNFLNRPETQIDQYNIELIENLRSGKDKEARIIRYSISGVPRLCAYRPISGSEEGWLMGTVAPLNESPFRYIDIGLIAVGGISFFLSLIAAIIASGFIKRPFDELAKADERTKLMLNMSPLCCQIWDSNLKIIDCNEAAVKLYGFKTKQEHIERFFDCYPEYQPDGKRSIETIHAFINKTLSEGYVVIDWMHQLPDGTPIPSKVTLIRVDYNSDYAIIAYTRDMREYNKMIEEMRRAEIADERNRAKSQFLAKMSHELRTPMNSIMGFTELALDSADLPKIKNYLGKILENSKWLLNLINEILDISKIESGRMELGHVPFEPYEIISRCQSVIMPATTKKRLELSVYAEPLIGKKLMGDPVRLSQALMNLLSNAVKFTKTGTIKLSSTVKNSNVGSATMYFEVKDSGIGMTPEQMENIFESFSQADSGTTRKFDGTGLGLTIANSIVKQMGGNLSVESTPGVGSVFSFEIVFETIDSPVSDTVHANQNEIEKPYFEGLVLICDDNNMNRQVICEHLSNLGLQTVAVDNGKVGVEKVLKRMVMNQKPFDLIFMDIFMPVMDGLEAVTKLKELEIKTPIVALTANIMAGELEKYRNYGMLDCLGKPFTAQELWRVLLKYLNPIPPPASLNENKQTQNTEQLQKMLMSEFVKNNQTRYKDLTDAIAAGDTKLAHRLMHSLKGNAGFIGKTNLQGIAKEAETLLKAEKSVPMNIMDALETELTLTLEELTTALNQEAYPNSH
ncbi:MAG: ATP-binding protein [Oscillospiraceae bacterium]|nr:ATP-binding protein [Oscillospiraceae bacterium]